MLALICLLLFHLPVFDQHRFNPVHLFLFQLRSPVHLFQFTAEMFVETVLITLQAIDVLAYILLHLRDTAL